MSGCDHIPGLCGQLLSVIVAGAEGVMLVRVPPTRCSDQVVPPGPGIFFCTTHFSFENRSLVDFEIGNESVGGDLEEHGNLQNEMRCALNKKL